MLVLLPIAFSLVIHHVTAADVDQFVGSWAYQKEGFGSFSLALRSDGTGVFFSDTGGTVLRWRLQDGTAKIEVASPPKNLVMVLRPTRNSNEATVEIENDTKLLRRVDPKEMAKQPPILTPTPPRTTRTTLKSIADLERAISAFCTSDQPVQSASVSAESKRKMGINRTNNQISLSLSYYFASNGHLPKGSVFSPVQSEPKSNTTKQVFLSDGQIAAFKHYLEDNHIKYEESYWQVTDPWGEVLAHYKSCHIYLTVDDAKKVTDTVVEALDLKHDEQADFTIFTRKDM